MNCVWTIFYSFLVILYLCHFSEYLLCTLGNIVNALVVHHKLHLYRFGIFQYLIELYCAPCSVNCTFLHQYRSDSGVVNIYDGSCLSNPAPDPLRSITNLTTSISNMCVNCTSEVMAVSSKKKKGALKLVHLPSKTVFSNWPGPKTLKGHVTATDFSPSSSFFAVGNDKGKALLFRLNYYSWSFQQF